MANNFEESKIDFSPGDWMIDRNNPGNLGQYTGRWRKAGPIIMIELAYPGGSRSFRPLDCLEPMDHGSDETVEDKIRKGHFGKLRDLGHGEISFSPGDFLGGYQLESY